MFLTRSLLLDRGARGRAACVAQDSLQEAAQVGGFGKPHARLAVLVREAVLEEC